MNRKEQTALIGMAGNLLLASAKTALSILSGSSALIADALHSFSDLLVSLIVLAGLKINKVKVEAMVTVLVGTLIISVAVGFAGDLFFHSQSPMSNIHWAVIGQVIVIAATYALYRFKTHVGTVENSESLVADGAHTKSDMYSSLGVLISLTGQLAGLNLDKIAAFIIFFLVLHQGLETLGRGISLFRGKDSFQFSFALKQKKRFVPLFLLFCLILYVIPGVYTIDQNSRAIKSTFGVADPVPVGPGLHLNLAYPFSDIRIVDTSSVRRLEYGFRTENPFADDVIVHQMETMQNSKRFSIEPAEQEILAGDGSIANLHLIVEYSVSDPFSYLIETENPEKILRLETESGIQKIVGSLTLFEILNSRRNYIEEEIRKRLNDLMSFYNTGLHVSNALIYSVTPHPETIYMFREVQNEEQARQTEIYRAEAIRARQLPYYRGLSYEKRVIAEAEAERMENSAFGETLSYRLMEKNYSLYGKPVSFRMLLDSRVGILNGAEKILIDSTLNRNLIRINGEQ